MKRTHFDAGDYLVVDSHYHNSLVIDKMQESGSIHGVFIRHAMPADFAKIRVVLPDFTLAPAPNPCYRTPGALWSLEPQPERIKDSPEGWPEATIVDKGAKAFSFNLRIEGDPAMVFVHAHMDEILKELKLSKRHSAQALLKKLFP